MGKNKKKPSAFRKNPRFLFDKRNDMFKKSKRQNSIYEPSVGVPDDAETVYRILCPTKKIGSVIGKGGDIIKALRDETHAKIKVGESVLGADERVVIIFSSSTKKLRASSVDGNPENDALDDKENEPMEPHCPAQHALLRVHEKIAEEDDLYGASDHEDNNEDSIVTVRLLVPSNQVGCLLGKGGHVIQKLRSETGANIRVLPSEHLPACAMGTDELVQISGASIVAKKALYEVSTLLYQNPRPPMNYPEPDGSGFYPPGPPMGNVPPPGNPMWSYRNSGFHGPPPMPWGGGFGNAHSRFGPGGFNAGPSGNTGRASAEFIMKILCPADKIGMVIGKGGGNVRQIQQETGANIHVEDPTGEADERVILVSCFDAPWNPRSPTIDAILQLQGHTHEISEKGTITTRLLVSSNKVGCLLGQGGHIITEMRRRCQADIRVISKDGKPKCASSDEELVQISGNVNVARNALTEIASRLRVRSLEGVNGSAESSPMGPFHGFGPSEVFPDRGLPPPGMLGPGSSGGYEHAKVRMREYEAPNYPVQPSGVGAVGYPNMHGSMEIKIPSSAITSVLGAGGSNISTIGQMSGARVKLNDPQAGSSDCIVEIHGSSDQMHAAQNLLHNYMTNAAQSYSMAPQQPPIPPAAPSFNLQQHQNPYAAATHSAQQQQQSSYASAAAQNYGSLQQHQSPYPSSTVSNYGVAQQQSPYASSAAAHNYDHQQHYPHYASAAHIYDPQQQQQQQEAHYSAAAVTYDAQQQQGLSYQ